MEMLMTYSWALILIVVVFAVMFYFGILNPQRIAPDHLTFQSGFTAKDFHLSSAGDFTLDLGNGMGRQIKVNGVNCTNETDPAQPAADLDILINAGSHEIVTTGGVTCPNVPNSGYYEANVYVWYTPVNTDVTYRVKGSLGAMMQ